MRRISILLLAAGGLLPFLRLAAQPVAPTPDQVARFRTTAAYAPNRAATLPALSVDTASREEVRQFYRAVYGTSEDVPMAWTGTYTAGGAGDTSAAFKEAVLLRINFYRALVGVPAAVTINSTFSAKAQQAALMMSANNALSHFPPASWSFYTAEGADAAANSNIALGYAGPDSIDGYMADDGDNNTAVGHRRWLIYPQTTQMGTGDVPGNDVFLPANAVWVFDGNFGTSRPATRTTAVPYPPAGFVPYQLVWPRWSFSLPGANFANATVTMTRNGQTVSTVREPLATGTGEPTLVWVYDDLDSTSATQHPRPSSDVTYTVTITNVTVGGASQNFSYNVTVFDPDVPGSDFTAVTVSGSLTPAVGSANTYTVAKPAFASGFEWRTLRFAEFNKTYGAEVGLDGIIAVSASNYNPVQSEVAPAGTAAYHLAHSTRANQTLTLPETFFVQNSNANITFLSRLRWATDSQVARVQASPDDGASWTDLYVQTGTNGIGESSFVTRTASLASFHGQTVRIRFAYTVADSGALFPQSDTDVGWVFDNITLAGLQVASAATNTSVTSGTSFSFTPTDAGTTGLQARGTLFGTFPLAWGPVKALTATAGPIFTVQPANRAAAAGESITLSAIATAGATYQWQYNGSTLPAMNGSSATLTNLQPDDTGLYAVLATSGGIEAVSSPAIVGLTTTQKVVGDALEFPDILHVETQKIYDQLLLKQSAATFTADSAQQQITRLSYIDLNDDIVQVEYAGPGSVSIVLAGSSGPATPVKYDQPTTSYMKGHAGIVVTGATEASNLTIFSVGRGTAVNQSLFSDSITYDGMADIAFVAIHSANGKFGGLRTANASYWDTEGFTGVYAPGVEFNGPVFVHDIDARQSATPVLMIGSALDRTWITGGNLDQTNDRAVQVSGLTELKFADGVTSHYKISAPDPSQFLVAKPNQARLERDGVDVTTELVVNP